MFFFCYKTRWIKQPNKLKPRGAIASNSPMAKILYFLKQVTTTKLRKWLQTTTFKVFGTIHEINNQDPIQHEIRLRLLGKVINSLPPRQKELFEEDTFLARFLSWNKFWKTSYAKQSENRAKNLLNGQEPLKNVHTFL